MSRISHIAFFRSGKWKRVNIEWKDERGTGYGDKLGCLWNERDVDWWYIPHFVAHPERRKIYAS